MRWTLREENIIKAEISKSQQNLTMAFERCALRMKNRTLYSITGYWYRVLRSQTPVYGTVTNYSVVINGKNYVRKLNSQGMPINQMLTAALPAMSPAQRRAAIANLLR